jgi:hypothetical protein
MCRLITFGGVVLVAFVISWLVSSEQGAPFDQYFLNHTTIPNLWGALNGIPALLGAIASGTLHGFNVTVFYIVFFIQWFVIGLGASAVICTQRGRASRKS